jgi:hypothetical protein
MPPPANDDEDLKPEVMGSSQIPVESEANFQLAPKAAQLVIDQIYRLKTRVGGGREKAFSDRS